MLGRSGALRSDQLDVEGVGDPPRDLTLQREQIANVTIEPLRPQMRICLGIDQLGVDADLMTRPPDASLQHIPRPELATDLPRFDRLIPIGESAVP